MQVTAYMQMDEETQEQSTEQRLLCAAREVYSREGIAKATTREIAKVAGVNEVTLFRRFQSKQGLLAAVLEETFLNVAKSPGCRTVADGATLRDIVTFYANADFDRINNNISLMRVIIGESHRLGELESEVLLRIFRPWKEEFAGKLQEAKDHGLMRADQEPIIVVDQLSAMIFVGALRADTRRCINYTPETYLSACIENILRAIAP
ncbi:TetR/AcrR family transcriptional regulator [Luteolibacter pohnpeiensis]|uniref:TetR/AcrR family transcriptional regulator n=1 Tax=Luteolibacter pohnpeiensis TaxID=454153 RepID=A0A934S6L3_9BACT|nr:TetR/AcrR family transcriptional regulator [Luteolibacter pohnpeiensis]MBK1882210.1 TetR/AcrR family transcriptional regulator [Luteolibacter pohnpeiensis]